MHPAPSVILFTVLSGAGFGYLAFLALGFPAVAGWAGFAAWGFGYAMAVSGLLASTFHLGNPQRALLAFSQWRSSWLSREAWTSVAALTALAPMALSDWLGLGLLRGFGLVGAAFCAATVISTAMIYAQMKTVPRWRDWSTPVMFAAFAVAGGGVLAAPPVWAAALALAPGAALILSFRRGDGAFAAAGHSLGSATGLDRLGQPSVFEQPHTGGNYLMREMIHVVGRRHAARLRPIALLLAAAVPALLLVILPVPLARPLAFAIHLAGALAARWLFFAEAEHVVGLYYGKRG
ncbi:MAG: dimethyl sulfoxide reductase anchor subunit [Rhodobacter sp.]|nr:dimethyl sulfoxide reductase anchor subunit [Rhodobacter sp.]